MCGIFGAIGKSINPGIIRALALANRERGTDSLGFFSNTGKFIKRADDPLACLGDDDFADFIDKSCRKGWFIAGHTRYATHGTVTDRNAHPFRFGRIIGIHNGVVSYPRGRKYRVDSEYLFDSLNQANGDYQTALSDISGYWGLAWFDGSDFYLQAHGNEVAVGRDDKGTWYFSSDWTHLDACARPTRNFLILDRGATIRFNCKSRKYETMPALVSVVRDARWESLKSVTSGKAGKSSCAGKTGSAKPDTHAARIESAEKSADPFHVENETDEAWARLDEWDEYTAEYN